MAIDINHCSDKHPWFLNSVNKSENFTDFFVWKDGQAKMGADGKPEPPNKWVNWRHWCSRVFGIKQVSSCLQLSVKGGPAWSFNANRKQFYLHQFGAAQPDFNLQNPALQFNLRVSELPLMCGRLVTIVNTRCLNELALHLVTKIFLSCGKVLIICSDLFFV